MKKNRIMRYLAAAFAAVLITTSTIPAYAEVIEEAATEQDEEALQLSMDEVQVEPSDEQKDEEVILADDKSDPDKEHQSADTEETEEEDKEETEDGDELNAVDTEAETEVEAEADDELTEEEDEEDDELLETVGPVAEVIGKGEYENINEAVSAWNIAGEGAQLVLLANVKTTDTIIANGGSEASPKILDLNGYGILYKGTGNNSVIVVNNGYFKLTDSAGTNKYYLRTDSDGRALGVYASRKGANNIEVTGGFIAGGTGNPGENNGGGIFVNGSGTFIMEGGTICGNKAKNGGGIISNGTFKMTGGTISNNMAGTDGNFYGGGIYVMDGSAEISGGVIRDNYAKYGGGLSNHAADITIAGGEISNNHAEWGGGVHNYENITMTGGMIKENDANLGGGVYNNTTSEFLLNGGEIIENTAEKGGGVYYHGAKLTMNGGSIKDNAASGSGAGVFIFGSCEFEMNGGDICDNETDGDGGGIVNDSSGSKFTMNGGRISGNEADKNGGGICNRGVITLESGEITGNKAHKNTSGGKGGGIYSENSVKMNGGKISSNESWYPGDGIFVDSGSFEMYGGEIGNNPYSSVHIDHDGSFIIKGNIYVSINDKTGKDAVKVPSSDATRDINIYHYIYVDPTPNGIAAVTASSGNVTSYNDFSEALNAWKEAGDGAKLTLLDDVQITDTIIVTAGTERNPMILDLNGYGILYKGEHGNVITINAEKCLELDDTGLDTIRYITVANGRGISIGTEPGTDTVYAKGGYITGGNGNINHGAGGIIIDKNDYGNGTLIMNGGTIIANTSTNGGSNSAGAIFDYGSFIMNGGYIRYNSGNVGGGVYVFSFGSFVMNGGEIFQNTAQHFGGGVNDTGSFILKGGSIVANRITDETEEYYSHGGGGVHATGKFLMYGGSISENYDKYYGGGISISSVKECKIYGGKINGNLSDGGSRGIYISSGSVNFEGSVFADDFSDGRGAVLIKGNTDDEIYEKVKDKRYITVLGIYADPDPVPAMTYTGSAIVPNFKVYNGTTLLDSKTDYTVSVKNNTNAGQANYTITGKGNYSFKIDGTFEIAGKSISDADIVVADIAPNAAGKSAYKPIPAMTYKNKKLANNKDFTVTYFKKGGITEVNPTEAGHYVARVTGKGNFLDSSTRDVPFIITSSNQIMVSKLTIAKIADMPYNGGKAIKPALSVKDGKTDVASNCYEVKYLNNTEVGTATVTITGIEEKGYIGSKSVTFKITGITLSKAKLDDKDAKTKFVYNGQPQTKNIELVYKQNNKDPGTILTGMNKTTYDNLPSGSSARRTVDYVVSYENNVNAGTATMLITGVNNWVGSVKKTFKIDKFDIKKNEGGKLTVSLYPETYNYSKAGAKPLPIVMFNSERLKNGVDYTLSYANNTAVGGTNTPIVKVTGKGNFTGVNDGKTFTIKKAPLAESGIMIAVNDVVYSKKKGNYKSAVTVTDSDGKKLAVNTDYRLVYSLNQSGEPALENNDIVEIQEGTDSTTVYAVIIADGLTKTPYTGKVYGSFRVCKNDISRLTAEVADQEYTGRPVTIEKSDITWKAGNIIISFDNFDILDNTYEKNINQGTASVLVRGKGDYGKTKKLTFKIKTKKQ